MKIFNAKQLQEIDRRSIEIEGITSWDLMERASAQVVEYLLSHHSDLLIKPMYVICGKGNNGGDGLAIARMLKAAGASVDVFLIESDKYSTDNLLNQEKLESIKKIDLNDQLQLLPNGYIIDCLFGYGLTNPLDEIWRPIVQQINDYQGTVVSIDLPSGLTASLSIESLTLLVEADETLTFQFPKESLLVPDYETYVGNCTVLDIQLNEKAIEETESNVFFITDELVRKMLKPRSKYSHKGTFGHVGIVGGSLGKIGAVLMCSKAALRTGCGLVTSIIPRCGYDILQTAVPEAMVLLDSAEHFIQDFTIPDRFQAIAVGIGLGTEDRTIKGFLNWLSTLKSSHSLVFDADALNILSLHPAYLTYIPKGSIFSPHPKELSRLIGKWDSDAEKLTKASEFAKQYELVLIIKGAHTVIVNSDGMRFYNSSGNAGMATGGTGDVLTGVLVSFRAQGYSSIDSAIAAVYLHGLAGDYAAKRYGEASLIASDVIEHIPNAYLGKLSN